jgi:integrase
MAAFAMASIRTHSLTKRLFFDFRYKGSRCREYTILAETAANRKQLEKVLARIESEIAAGTFVYRQYFPNSKLAARFDGTSTDSVTCMPPPSPTAYHGAPIQGLPHTTVLFKDFAETWFSENEVRWRKSYRRTIRDILNAYLLPTFGEKVVSCISKAEILQFRSALAKVPGQTRNEGLSASRINYIMMALRQIMAEAADRYDFSLSFRNIKPLKLKKGDVKPFTLEEVKKILDTVRPDFRNYYTVRFFTGLRTGEVDGLKWAYVDLAMRLILVRETIVDGEEEYTKNDFSQRDVHMSEIVYQALLDQRKTTFGRSDYVFCNREGQPFDHNNITKRVWYPLLRHLDIRKRRPYQTRHTAATLWLAAGENPEWIARQLGHASTEMLFRVYSRFVPNLTRRDGAAMERLISGHMSSTPVDEQPNSEVNHVA